MPPNDIFFMMILLFLQITIYNNLFANGNWIIIKNDYEKLLGIILGKKLSFKTHVKCLFEMTNQKLHALVPPPRRFPVHCDPYLKIIKLG